MVVIFSDKGVTYRSQQTGEVKTTDDPADLTQRDYDAMTPWERYCVLNYFADQGDEVKVF